VAQTREFLVRLASPYVEGGIKGVRREIRAEALALLRHYPYVWSGEAIAKCDCPAQDNAARQDILTDAEREALVRLCDAVTDYAADDRKTNGETFAEGDERAVAIVRGWLARLT
jgi:hypothetical protein